MQSTYILLGIVKFDTNNIAKYVFCQTWKPDIYLELMVASNQDFANVIF